MPFKSKAQRGLMYAKHPKIAARWEDKYGSGGKNLPDRLTPGDKKDAKGKAKGKYARASKCPRCGGKVVRGVCQKCGWRAKVPPRGK